MFQRAASEGVRISNRKDAVAQMRNAERKPRKGAGQQQFAREQELSASESFWLFLLSLRLCDFAPLR
jgi:hypothetical protein